METKRVVLVSVVFALVSTWCGVAFAASEGGSYALDARAADAGRQFPDIAVSPDSLYADLLTGETETQILTIENIGDADLVWEIGIEFEELARAGRPIGFHALERDGGLSSGMPYQSGGGTHESGIRDLGDVLGTYYNFPVGNTGMAWAGDALFVVDESGTLYKYDVETQQIVETYAIHSGSYGMTWDGEFLWIGQYGGNVYGYDLSGAPVGSFSSPVDYPAIAWDGSTFLITDAFSYAAPFYLVDYDGSVIQTFSSSYGGYASALEWVAGHVGGEIWVNDYSTGRICRLSIEAYVVALVSEFPFYDTGFSFSLSHDGTDLWWSDYDGPLYQIDDGIEERRRLVASPESGVVPAGTSTSVEVTFDAWGLFGGDYLADLVVSSNDPDEPEVVVPTHLRVTGAPDIAVSDTLLSYDGVFIGGSATETLTVSNEGTHLLTVSDVSTNHTDYTVDVTSFVLAPGGSQPVAVEFSPSSEGVITGALTITSDDPDEDMVSVLLEGEGLLPPDIGVSPDSLYADLLTGQTDTQILTIENTGDADLVWEIGVEFERLARADRGIGFYARERDGTPSSGVPYQSGGSTHESGVRDLGDVLGIYYNFPGWSTGMVWAGDALFVVDYEGGTLYKYDVETQQIVETHAIHSYPFGMTWDGEFLWIGQEGGNVYGYDLNGALVGSFSSPVDWVPSIAWTGSYFLITDALSYAAPFYLVDYYGIVIQTFSSSYDGYAYALEWVPGHAGGKIWVNEIDRICQLSLATGAVTLVREFPFYDTHDAYSLSHDGTDLWWSDRNGPLYQIDDGIEERCWLVASPESGVVPAGTSTYVEVTFDAWGLFGGDYLADVVVLSNDPDEPEVVVPTHLHVTGAPDIAVSDTLLSYGEVFIVGSATETLVVSNEGTDILTVSDVSTDHTDYTVDVTSFVLAPGGTQPVAVEFSPRSEGVIAGTLTITSDDPDEGVVSVLLEGEGLMPPDIAVSPDSLYAYLVPGQTDTQILTIENSGGSDLEWGIRVRAGGGDSLRTYALAAPRTVVAEPDGGAAPAPARRATTLTARLADLTGVHILWDTSHGQGGLWEWSTIVADLTDRGATVEESSAPITSELLGGYDVVWTLECSDTWTSAELSALAGWVAEGGGLLLEGDDDPSVLAYNGILAALGAGITYSTTNGTSGTTSKIYAHKTTEDIASISLSYPRAHLSSVVAPAAFLIDDMLSVPNTACSNVGHGRVVATADEHLFGNYNVGSADNQLFGNQVFDWLAGPQWVWAEPAEGTVAAGAAVDVLITFDASGLFGDDYFADLVVGSNDPNEPELLVPTYMHVTGEPDIAVSDTLLSYGVVFLWETVTDTLTVLNEGTDTLTVSDISSDEPAYSVDVTTFNLGPCESQAVVLSFTPESVGSMPGTLTILSNDPDEGTVYVEFEGEGVEPPDIGVAPDSLYADLFIGQTDRQILTIENTGGSDLEWGIGVRSGGGDSLRTYALTVPRPAVAEPDGGGGGAPAQARRASTLTARLADLTRVRILWDASHGQNPAEAWSTIIADLTARGATVEENYEPITGELLGGYDVVWTTDCSDTWSSGELSALVGWVAEGGGLLLEGDNNSSVLAYNDILAAMGAGITYSTTNGTGGTTSNIYPHETTEGIASIYLLYPSAHLSSVVVPAAVLVDDLSGVPNIACSNVGHGRVVAAAEEVFADSSVGSADNQLFGNQVFDWLAGPQWVWAEPAEGTVAAGATVDVSITFDASGLFGGDYFADLVVGSNDPDEPEVLVPTHLQVTGVPDIAVSDTLLAYGEVPVGFTVTQILEVSNVGTDELTVSAITTDHPDYWHDVFTVVLAPGHSQSVVVGFSPSDEGVVVGTLTILSDDPDEGTVYVELEGEGVAPPDIAVSPDSLYADLLAGETDTQILTIENTGDVGLVWEIGTEFEELARASRPIGFHARERDGAPSSGVPYQSGGGTHESGVRDLGDVLGTYYNFPVLNTGMAWAGDALFVVEHEHDGTLYKYDVEAQQTVEAHAIHSYPYGMAWDGEFLWIGQGGGNVYGYDPSGGPVGSFSSPVDWPAIAWDGSYFLITDALSYAAPFYLIDYDGTVIQTFSSSYDGELTALEWVAGHRGGEIWVNDPETDRICQLSVETGVVTLVSEFPFYDTSYSYSLSHDGTDLWWSDLNGPLYQIDDGIDERWLVPSPESGVVPAGGSTSVDVTFDTWGLLGGDYFADLVVSSNDLDEPEVVVPTHLHVTDVPDIAVSDTLLQYDEVFIGLTVSDTLVVLNEGTDTLTVSDISSDEPAYSVDVTTFNLGPRESQAVLVSFTPGSAGSMPGTLTILSNDPDEGVVSVLLEGEGVAPPDIAVSPDSLYADLLTGETETQILTIENTGDADLVWEIGIEFAGLPRASRPIGSHALERDGAPSSGEPYQSAGGTHESGVRDLGDVLGTYYNFPVGNTGMAWAGEALFVVDPYGTLYRYDVATEQIIETHAIHSEPFGMTWDGEFLWIGQEGGNVYGYDLSGAPAGSLSSPVYSPAIAWTGSNFLITDALSHAAPFYLVDYDGSVIQTFSSSYGGYANALEWVAGHVGGEIWVSDSGTDRICQLSLETGAVTLVDEFSFYDTDNSYSLSHDGIDLWWSDADGPLYQINDGIEERRWLAASPESGVVPAGASTSVEVTFDASWLFGGDYLADVVVSSNDLDEPEVVVPTYLHVTGVPDIAVSDTLLSYGGVFIGLTVSDTLVVLNEGTDTLVVSDIDSDEPAYSVDVTTFDLGPRESQTVLVSFTPGSAGSVPATLTILSNDPDEGTLYVALYGEGVAPPDIAVSPDSLYADLLTGETETQILTIENTGDADLVWKIGIEFEELARAGRPIGFYAHEEDGAPSAGVPYQSAGGTHESGVRDLGDVLGTYYDFPASNIGMAWAGDALFVVDPYGTLYRYDVETQQIVETHTIHDDAHGMTWDGEFLWIGQEGGNVYGYDLSGASVGSFSSPVDWPATAWDGSYFLIKDAADYAAPFYLVDYDGSVIQTFSSSYDGYANALEWVVGHDGGEIWVNDYDTGRICQLSLETGVVTLVSEFPFYDTGLAYSLSHDGRDLWWSDFDGPLYQIDDGIEEWRWLVASPEFGVVPAGASTYVEVTFDASGLLGGDYFADLMVSSDDPDEPEVLVPSHLHVTGVPDIAVSDTLLSYGGVFIGLTVSDTLVVLNEGTDLLTVSDITSDEPAYSVDTTAFNLGPFESQAVLVSFTPGSVGSMPGTLTILSNDPDEGTVHVALEGEGVAPPDIVVSPDSLYADLLTGQTDTQILTIENSGVSDLEWGIDVLPAGGDSLRTYALTVPRTSVAKPDGGRGGAPAPVRRASALTARLADLTGVQILWDASHGQGEAWDWSTIVADLTARGATVTENHDPITGELLGGYDVVWTIDCSDTWTSGELSALAEWVAGGGGLLLEGDGINSVSAYNAILAALAAGIEYSMTDGTSGTTSNIYPHEMTGGVVSVYLDAPLAHLSSVTGPASILIEDISDVPNTAYSSVGHGRVVATADELFGDYAVGYADNQLFGNQVFDWLAGPWWVWAEPAEGTVAAGATVDVSITFDASGLFGGDYFADLVVGSNDPDEPEIVVPTHLHVTGAPDIAVSDTLLAYGEVIVGFTMTQTLEVSNVGTDELIVSAFMTDHPDYWTDISALVLAPGESESVVVNFTPSGEGVVVGTLTILSDDPDEGVVGVALEGEGVMPHVWHVPGDVPTIGAGIDSASSGDVVLVAPGTYAGEHNRGFNFAGKEIVVMSEAGAESTIIDCGEQDRAFTFNTGESSAVTVRGFTIVNGRAYKGGAIYLHSSSPTIMDCAFSGNGAGAGGGGAILCDYGSSPTIRGCSFYDNTSDGMGGAIRISFASPSILRCTLARNEAPFGGGVGCNASMFTIANCVIAFNTDGGAIRCSAVGEPSIYHCCVFANTGGDSLCGDYHDNLFADPLFCDMANRDLTLCENSPCLPLGSPWGDQIGAYGQGCDACSSTPVEISFYAVLNASGTVTLRWTVSDLTLVDGFNIYRGTSSEGPFAKVNEQMLLAVSPGEYEDKTVWPGTTFWYQLMAVPGDGEGAVTELPVSVTTPGQLVAALHPPRPNPFRGETSVGFDVPPDAGRVKVAVYNIRGQLVRELFEGAPGSGRYVTPWDGRDLRGTPASSGVYFVMLEAGTSVRTRKLLLVK